MSNFRIWQLAFLAVLIVIEVRICSGAFGKYFNLDSVFYVINSPRTAEELGQTFTTPDPGKQYRPLTLAFMALFVPLFKLNPHPYHYIPIVFHVANTILFYLLARRLLQGALAPLAAVSFWGLHSVTGWIAYDATCLSDYGLVFLLLSSLLLATEGSIRHSPALAAGAVVFFVLALLTKEAAVTIPLALIICLVLAGLRSSAAPHSWAEVRDSLKKAAPLTGIFLGIAVAYSAFLIRWIVSGSLYAQGQNAAYNINPSTNLLAKAKYLFWALNLPDTLVISRAQWIRPLIFILMGLFFACLAAEVVRRRGRIGAEAWAGLIWFVGMNVPAMMLSHRLAKWYLYVPLLGLSLTVGSLIQGICARFRTWKPQVVAPGLLLLCVIPTLFSSVAQNRSYLAFSDAAYQSGVLESFIKQTRSVIPASRPHVTFFILPSFEPDTVAVVASPPVNEGKLLELYYPGTSFTMLFAQKGQRLSSEQLRDPDLRILHEIQGRFYDVTRHYRSGGRMTLFVLPTSEGQPPPLLLKNPAGGMKLYENYVQIRLGDMGATLPSDYFRHDDLWILQYMNGHFQDVTDYYEGRRRNGAVRLVKDTQGLQVSMNRDEIYPDYDRFATPTGRPVFYPTPQKEILTQIAGSTVVVPTGIIPPGAALVFDVSWMYDLGDGGWAEMTLRAGGRESTIFRKNMPPNPKGEGPAWEAVRFDLGAFAGKNGDLILRCYNDRGRNTIADWLNWRDISIEVPDDTPPQHDQHPKKP